MAVRVAINGFGRIGRNCLRIIVESQSEELEVVAINDLASTKTNAHLFEFDSVHGRFAGNVTSGEDWMDAGRGKIRVTAERDPAKLPWSDVDIVLECTGVFRSGDDCQVHLDNGAKRVLLSAPGKGVDRTLVQGVNHETLQPGDQIVSNASCTTNCLAPVAKVLNDAIGIDRGFMTTIHAYTGDQPVLDTAHSDLARARAAALSMIPTSTGAAKAVGLVLPELDGKLGGVAVRVPTPNVSCVDLTFVASRNTSVDEINELIRDAAKGSMAGILDFTDKPLVSIDFNHSSFSSIFATDQTHVVGGDFVRILSWYDNEWGFSARMVDSLVQMGKHL